jgi:hypothetical protein
MLRWAKSFTGWTQVSRGYGRVYHILQDDCNRSLCGMVTALDVGVILSDAPTVDKCRRCVRVARARHVYP